MSARLTRIALAVRDPAAMAADLGAVFGMAFAPADEDCSKLRGPDGYDLAPLQANGAPLQALVFSVSAFEETAARLERAGAICTADRITDGRREMTWIGTALNVPVIIRDDP